MKTIRLITVAALMFCSVSSALALQPSPGILTCGYGTHPNAVNCTGSGCTAADGAFLLTGALTCLPGMSFTEGTAKLNYIQGVCGDQPSLPGMPAVLGSCGNQFYYRFEVCSDPANAATQGALFSGRTWGAWRICLDASGAGDCSGTTPAGIVISRGSAISFLRELVGDGPGTHTFENRPTFQIPFAFNGFSNRSMAFKVAVGHYTTELTTTSCGPGGCGIQGCLTKLK